MIPTMKEMNVLMIKKIPAKVDIKTLLLKTFSYFVSPIDTSAIPGCNKADNAKLRKATLILAKTAERDKNERQR